MAAVSLNDDVDTDKELMAHGYSNLLSGLVGSVYDSNTLLIILLLTYIQSELPGLCEYSTVCHTRLLLVSQLNETLASIALVAVPA